MEHIGELDCFACRGLTLGAVVRSLNLAATCLGYNAHTGVGYTVHRTAREGLRAMQLCGPRFYHCEGRLGRRSRHELGA